MFGYREPINKDLILSKISEADIFYKYLGIYPDTKVFFCNPLRADTEAGCRFYYDSRGVLKFNDMAIKQNLDCFNVVQKIHNNCTFKEALEKIAEDFNIFDIDIDFNPNHDYEKVLIKKRNESEIRIKRGTLTAKDIRWWESNGWFEPQRDKFKLYLATAAWLNGNQIYTYNSNDPCFVYHFGFYDYKLYFPFRKKFRFFQNRGNIIQGWSQLPESGEYLLITKSYKDVGCMDAFGIPSIAPLSESFMIPQKDMDELKTRFKYIFTLFDRDRAGMILSQKMRKLYGTIPLLFDSATLIRKKSEPKDWTDHYKKLGTNYMLDLIEETKFNYSLW